MIVGAVDRGPVDEGSVFLFLIVEVVEHFDSLLLRGYVVAGEAVEVVEPLVFIPAGVGWYTGFRNCQRFRWGNVGYFI